MDGGTMRLILTQNLSEESFCQNDAVTETLQQRARNEEKSIYSELSVKLLQAALRSNTHRQCSY
jgi:hypothetical protein